MGAAGGLARALRVAGGHPRPGARPGRLLVLGGACSAASEAPNRSVGLPQGGVGVSPCAERPRRARRGLDGRARARAIKGGHGAARAQRRGVLDRTPSRVELAESGAAGARGETLGSWARVAGGTHLERGAVGRTHRDALDHLVAAALLHTCANEVGGPVRPVGCGGSGPGLTPVDRRQAGLEAHPMPAHSADHWSVISDFWSAICACNTSSRQNLPPAPRGRARKVAAENGRKGAWRAGRWVGIERPQARRRGVVCRGAAGSGSARRAFASPASRAVHAKHSRRTFPRSKLGFTGHSDRTSYGLRLGARFDCHICQICRLQIHMRSTDLKSLLR